MKQYLIAGGSKGIGAALAAQLLEKGHKVITISRGETTLSHPNLEHFRSDLASKEMNLPAINTLDGLVYCPGSISLKPFASIKEEDFLKDLEVNFFGAVRLIKNYLPLLKNSSGASILLFSTVAVQTGMPYHASIASSKGAIEGLTRSLAAEFAPKIRVNAIAPSLTDTSLAAPLLSTEEKRNASAKRHPLQRIATANELATLAAFLLEEAGWMTGQIVHYDGGISSVKPL